MPKHKLLFSDILAREEEAPERIKTCEELVADRVPPRVPSPVSGLSYSLIESMLPQELLVYIVDMLDSDDYLTVQFVCSRLKAATRRQDGTLKAKMNAIFDRRAYAATMAKIEAGLRPSVKLQKWTCSNCAKRLGVWDGRRGFDTKRDKRFDYRRLCMKCDAWDNPERVYKVNEVYWIMCEDCFSFCELRNSIRGSEFSLILSGTLLHRIEEDLDAEFAKSKSRNWFCHDCSGDAVANGVQDMSLDMDSLLSHVYTNTEERIGDEEV